MSTTHPQYSIQLYPIPISPQNLTCQMHCQSSSRQPNIPGLLLILAAHIYPPQKPNPAHQPGPGNARTSKPEHIYCTSPLYPHPKGLPLSNLDLETYLPLNPPPRPSHPESYDIYRNLVSLGFTGPHPSLLL
ncbi:hypothetical protein BO82DRAFT_107600 [Aspergillus uvarum CBS 121591]|uniref:Uncharacterized protein n=1 Tax=Aspergillus uvarum CBS 121591 TaxID=1448315 RepID=A0A319DM25_9EURO|nr:hypothetical protein BO82DRAFT_107600 [Aspergillus uvarum CBS 121591]PYH80472.1 hypothetical protein BO82DRAFT_107600 [Aspergillus uvarum CBS 121591]